jgi:hypothetical protein
MRIFNAAAVVLAAVSLAACEGGESPTASIQPGRPSFDGSGMVGSGNRDGSAGTSTAPADTTSTQRGGSGMVGSGN